jgi:biotin transport system substrate-specific component
MLTAVLLKPSEAFISVLLYLVLGFIGLPVFSGFNSGLAYILGPTGGFLISFPIAALLISYFKGDMSVRRLLLVNILFGIVLVYLIAILWMHILLSISIISAMSSLLVFVFIDTGKAILAAFVGTRLNGISVLN